MKRLIYSLLLIATLAFVIDRIGGMIMSRLYDSSKDVTLAAKMQYLMNDCSQDMLLLGTSRAHDHYVPAILKDSLGISVYNGGFTGSGNIYSQYIILNLILSHHTPKIICLDVRTHDFTTSDNPFGSIAIFAPYIGLNARADSVFREAGIYWRYVVSHLYRYNARVISNIFGFMFQMQKYEENGYMPIFQPPHFPDTLKKSDFVFSCDSNKVKYIRKFISLCREHDILLVFTVSPAYDIVAPDQYSVLKQIAAENDIPFFDYHSAGLYLDHPEYFRDKNHLWDKGARLFTSVFAHDLKMYLDSIGFFKQEVE